MRRFQIRFQKRGEESAIASGHTGTDAFCQTGRSDERGFISGFMKSGMELLNIREMVKNIGGKFSVLWIND